MKEPRMEDPRSGIWMKLLLRSFSATCALVGLGLLVAGTMANAEGTSGLVAIGLGVVMVVAALAALAPIASSRALQHERATKIPAPAPVMRQPTRRSARDARG